MLNLDLHEYSDLDYALKWNYEDGDFEFKDIEGIAAHVPGMNDEANWYWIVKFKKPINNKWWAIITGWCDYTGWDCQAGVDVRLVESTTEAVSLAPLVDSDGRRIRGSLIGQLEGQEPYGSVLISNSTR